MSETNIISKISMKTIGAQPKPHTIKEGEKFWLASFYGLLTSHDLVQTAYGDSTRFHGDIEAVNLGTGEVFRSNKLFVPGVVEDMIKGAIDANEGSAVEFALQIGVEHSAKGSTGYAFMVKPLRESRQTDALAHLRSDVTEKLAPLLPAPSANDESGAVETEAPVAKAAKRR